MNEAEDDVVEVVDDISDELSEMDEDLEDSELQTISIPPPPPPQLQDPEVHYIYMIEENSSPRHSMADTKIEYNDPIEYKTPNGWERGNFFKHNENNTCDIILKNRAIKYNIQVENVFSIKHIKFKQVHLNTQIPSGWRKMSVEEASEYKMHIMPTLNQWAIVLLDGGRIDGSGYGGQIHRGKFNRPSLYGRQYIINSYHKEVSQSQKEPIVLDGKLKEAAAEQVIDEDTPALVDELIVNEDKVKPLDLDGKLKVVEQVDSHQGNDMYITPFTMSDPPSDLYSEDKIYIVDMWTPRSDKGKTLFDFDCAEKNKKPLFDGKNKADNIIPVENSSILSQ